MSWRSKKQNIVARSSVEAEFRGMAFGLYVLLWLRIVLEDLKIKIQDLIELFCDNQLVISIVHNPVQYDKTKHIEIDRHCIKEKLDACLISIPYVPSKEQVADVLTKGLVTNRFEDLIGKLGMIYIHSPV